MERYKTYVIGKDECPKHDDILKDDIILKDDCTGCKYYKGFVMWSGYPSVKCSFNSDTQSNE